MSDYVWIWIEEWKYWGLMGIIPGHASTTELITLEPRPSYCDRGHWCAKPVGLPSLWVDEQDGFPRYFMDLERAKLELHDWLLWKLKREGAQE